MVLFVVLLGTESLVPFAPLFYKARPEIERRLGVGQEIGRLTVDGRTGPLLYFRIVAASGGISVGFSGERATTIERSFGPLSRVGWSAAMRLCGYSPVGVRILHSSDVMKAVTRITGGSLPVGYVAEYTVALTQTKPIGPRLRITAPA